MKLQDALAEHTPFTLSVAFMHDLGSTLHTDGAAG